MATSRDLEGSSSPAYRRSANHRKRSRNSSRRTDPTALEAALRKLLAPIRYPIINVSSAVGSLTANADPAAPYHASFGPVYPASKAALNAMTLAMMVELESTGIKINLVSPRFTKTNLNGYEGTQSLEEGSREIVRVAMLGPDGPSGTFTRWENAAIPW